MDTNWTMCASNWTDEPRTHRDASGRVKSSEDPARAHPWWLATVPAGRETDTYYHYKLTELINGLTNQLMRGRSGHLGHVPLGLISV